MHVLVGTVSGVCFICTAIHFSACMCASLVYSTAQIATWVGVCMSHQVQHGSFVVLLTLYSVHVCFCTVEFVSTVVMTAQSTALPLFDYHVSHQGPYCLFLLTTLHYLGKVLLNLGLYTHAVRAHNTIPSSAGRTSYQVPGNQLAGRRTVRQSTCSTYATLIVL